MTAVGPPLLRTTEIRETLNQTTIDTMTGDQDPVPDTVTTVAMRTEGGAQVVALHQDMITIHVKGAMGVGHHRNHKEVIAQGYHLEAGVGANEIPCGPSSNPWIKTVCGSP